MDIKTTPLTVSQMLLVHNVQFVIPPYQRRYSWQKKQIVQFFDDIKNLPINDTHFLGTIVCLTETMKTGINKLEIVDGQQRMTTLILILDTIKDIYVDLGNQREADRIEDLVTCVDLDGKRINKIILGDLDRSDFKKIIDLTSLDAVKNKKLLEAYQVIKELLDEMGEEEFTSFKEKIVHHTKIVQLDVSEARDAFKLFEIINNRGLSLSPTDIIKNFLLGHASIIDDDTLDKVKSEWTRTIINMDGQNMDDFFRQYLSGILGRKISFTLLTDLFKKYYIEHVNKTELLSEYNEFDDLEAGFSSRADQGINKVSPIHFICELQDASNIYAKILNRTFEEANINEALYNLQRIRSFPTYTFILNLMRRDIIINDKLAILHLLEVFMLRRNICEYRTSELDDIFSKLAKFSDIELVEKVRIYLLENMPPDNEFQAKIVTYDFYGQFIERAKYILEMIEYYKIGGKRVKIFPKTIHLEHIIPQTITTRRSKEQYGDWERYLGNNALKEHSAYVSKIGNMTLLSMEDNIKISNNSFQVKRSTYAEVTDVKLLRELSRYKEFKFRDVTERSEKLAKLCVKIWQIR